MICPVSTETEFREAMEREQGFAVTGHGPRQSADHVAQRDGPLPKRPRAEVYPHRASRALVIFNALAPGLCDRVIRRFGRKPIRQSRDTSAAKRRESRGGIRSR